MLHKYICQMNSACLFVMFIEWKSVFVEWTNIYSIEQIFIISMC